MCLPISPCVLYDHCPQLEGARVVATVAVAAVVVAQIAPSSAEVGSRLARVEAGIAVVGFAAAVVVVAADSNQFEPPVLETATVDSSPAEMVHSHSAVVADFHFGTAKAVAKVASSLAPVAEVIAAVAPNLVVVWRKLALSQPDWWRQAQHALCGRYEYVARYTGRPVLPVR